MVQARFALALLAAVVALICPPARAWAQPPCQFLPELAAMRELVGADTVGDCLEDEHPNLDTGDIEQRTTGGRLIRRQIDSITLFTDGSITWVNGPDGLQSRGNNERFGWEIGPAEVSGAASPASDPASDAAALPIGPSLFVIPPADATPVAASSPPGPTPVPVPEPTRAAPPTIPPPITTPTSSTTATPTRTPAPSGATPSSKPSSGGRTDPVGGQCPPSHAIKGATSAKGEKLFYEPGRPEYARLSPETCFTAGGDARDAGYTSSKR